MNRMAGAASAVIKCTWAALIFCGRKIQPRSDPLGDQAPGLIRLECQPQGRGWLPPYPTDRVPMSRSPMIVRTVAALRRALDGVRTKKATIALVPTMGALHD